VAVVASKRSEIGIALLGVGTIGSGVASALLHKADTYARTAGCPLRLLRVLERDPERPPRAGIDPSIVTTDFSLIQDDPAIDIVIEVLGGEYPACDFIRAALARGKYVVTANKEVMAKHGLELRNLAWEHGVDILYEASVGGGIPIIAPLKRDLLANDIVAISTIINGTTNYILTSMSREGRDFSEALAQAQTLGYAEPDPTNDVEGIDAAYKLAILASLAFHVNVRLDDVYYEGITRLTSRDFRYAQELGYTIKLLALAKKQDTFVQVRVHPVLLPEEEPLAKVDGVLNAVQVEGDLLGRALFEGRGAGPLPTSSAVIADVLDAAHSVITGGRERAAWRQEVDSAIVPMGELRTRYYLRVTVADRPGVLAQIARVLGDGHISIASVIQKEANQDAQTAELVIMTHQAQEKAMRVALAQLAELPVVTEIGNFVRVEG
jgi:homoserine dehydrogenase